MKGSIGNVGYEGFLHDYKRIWIKGFKYNIGRCSAMEAELWVVLQGLRLTWNDGYRKVYLEVDSLMVVN